MSVELHSLDRAIRQMSIGGVAALERRRHMLGYDQLGEIENQFQIPISGAADESIAWTSFELDFDIEFYFAPEQRDSPLTMPQFSYGAVITGEPIEEDTSNPTGAVLVTACVQEWKTATDDRDSITGAKLAVGVCVPGGVTVEFNGYLHLAFQGYGAPTEDIPELDVGT